MKRTLSQLICKHLGDKSMTLYELAALVATERHVRNDSIRGQLRAFIDKGLAESRRGADGLLHYRMLPNVNRLGGNPRLNELDKLLAAARHQPEANL